MQRVRRLAPVVAVVLLGGVVLAGCRSAPDVAAYVGSEKITENQVDEIIDDFTTGQAAAPASPGAAEGAPARQLSRTEVVTTLVLQRVCDKLKADKGFTVSPVPADQVASQEGLPANSTYARSRADLWSCLTGGVAIAKGTPTDEELLALYNRAVGAGAINPAQAPFDAVKGELAGDQQIQQAIAASRLFSEGAKTADISINPRYRPLEFPIFSLQDGSTIVAVPLGEEGLTAVSPAPVPATEAAAAPVAPQ